MANTGQGASGATPPQGGPPAKGAGANSIRGNAALMGVTGDTLQQFFVMHRHAGGPLDGNSLYGPYFIKDSANGKLYKIVCTNGVLGVAV